MSPLALTLNVVVGLLWLGITTDLVRRPPPAPARASLAIRRLGWGLLAVVALGLGTWGVPVRTTTSDDRPRDPGAGQPAEAVVSFLRTPLAIVERSVALDGEGRTIRDERRETLQLPLLLLVLMGTTVSVRWRSRTVTNGRSSGAGAALVLVCAGLSACAAADDDAPEPAVAARPDRDVLDVRWDTLVHVRSGLSDTTLFSASSPVADASGFAVMDPYGFRVARFDWDGTLLEYLGARGSGPGEFLGLRHLEVDGRGTLWALDVENARLTGFSRDGQVVDEIGLGGLERVPSDFAVRHDGGAFSFMLSSDVLEPRTVDREGVVASGPAIRLEEGRRAFGLALQGLATRTDTLDGWVYALGAGDGILPMRDVAWDGRRLRYPELVPFPDQSRVRTRDGAMTSTTTRMTRPAFSAVSLDADGGVLYVLFYGSTPLAGRLLERWDAETGTYLDTVVLPRPGHIAVWDGRIVLAATNPEPEVLVLRARAARS